MHIYWNDFSSGLNCLTVFFVLKSNGYVFINKYFIVFGCKYIINSIKIVEFKKIFFYFFTKEAIVMPCMTFKVSSRMAINPCLRAHSDSLLQSEQGS